MNDQKKKKKLFTSELCNSGERGILPDNNIVVGISMGWDQLFVVRCKHQWWDLKQKLSTDVATKLKLETCTQIITETVICV